MLSSTDGRGSYISQPESFRFGSGGATVVTITSMPLDDMLGAEVWIVKERAGARLVSGGRYRRDGRRCRHGRGGRRGAAGRRSFQADRPYFERPGRAHRRRGGLILDGNDGAGRGKVDRGG